MTLMEKEILEQPKAMAGIKAANIDTINKLVADIKSRDINFVYFAARGTSDHASIYAQYMLGRCVGIASGLATPSVITSYGKEIDLSHALVIGVSQSGKAADALAVMAQGKKCGAITVSVTNEADSPMAKEADYHLYCNVGPEISVAATKTFTAQMYLLALLTAVWSGNEKLMATLDKVPAAMEEMMKTLPAQIEEIAPRYRYMRDGFTLGRGVNYPVALESALKLKETNYVRMQGAALSDFWHGPLAQVEPETVVILYAAEGPVFDDTKKMLEKLDELEAEVILVTDSAELAKDRKLAFVMPNLGCDCAAPFFNAVFAQLFACKLTAVKGRNPDAPRNLKKVTITK